MILLMPKGKNRSLKSVAFAAGRLIPDYKNGSAVFIGRGIENYGNFSGNSDSQSDFRPSILTNALLLNGRPFIVGIILGHRSSNPGGLFTKITLIHLSILTDQEGHDT